LWKLIRQAERELSLFLLVPTQLVLCGQLLQGTTLPFFPHLLWVIVYAVVLFFAATSTFKAKMKG